MRRAGLLRHLAGRVAVELTRKLESLKVIRAFGDRQYEVGPRGEKWLAKVWRRSRRNKERTAFLCARVPRLDRASAAPGGRAGLSNSGAIACTRLCRAENQNTRTAYHAPRRARVSRAIWDRRAMLIPATLGASSSGSTQPAMPKQSAGILLYRNARSAAQVFLVHPGGPFWATKDEGAWSIPKGEFAPGEDALDAAKREFQEETGAAITGEFAALKPVKQPSGKIVYAWAVEGDIDASAIRSNTFSIEIPRGSGKLRTFPEVDRAGWFNLDEARIKILKGQLGLLEEFEKSVANRKR